MATGNITDIHNVGACSHRTAVTVTEEAQQITITASKNTIEFINTGTNTIYYGGSGVNSTNGFPIYRRVSKSWSSVKSSFSIYVVCAAGETSTLRIVEYD